MAAKCAQLATDDSAFAPVLTVHLQAVKQCQVAHSTGQMVWGNAVQSQLVGLTVPHDVLPEQV